MSKLLFVISFLISGIGFGQLQHSGEAFNGIQRAKDESGKYWLVNKYDVKIASLDSIQLTSKEILDAIDASGLPKNDKLLVGRVVLMYGNDPDRMKELMNIAKTFPEVNRVIMEQCHNKLLVMYGKRKLKKMLKAKK